MTQDDIKDTPEATEAGPATPVLRKRALIEAVAAASGQRPAVVRAVSEALIGQIAAALDRGESLALPPLGRLTVVRSREAKPGAGPTLVLRLKRPGPGGTAAPAPAAETSDA